MYFDAVVMEKHITSLEPGVHIGSDTMLTLCENSAKSEEFLITNNCGLLSEQNYKFITTKLNSKTKQMPEYTPKKHVIPMQNKNDSEFYIIKEYLTDSEYEAKNQEIIGKTPRMIAPKCNTKIYFHEYERNVIGDNLRKRDQRRAIHNEVERRRRDKINSWIFKLKQLIPETSEANRTNITVTNRNVVDSKSRILIRACEYIKEMQEELEALRQCVLESEKKHVNQPIGLIVNGEHSEAANIE